MAVTQVIRDVVRAVVNSPVGVALGGGSPQYFVDFASGNDTNDGLTATAAKKTVAGVLAIPPKSFGTVNFKAGSVWPEMFKPLVPVRGKSYSSGSVPKFDGAEVIDPSAFTISTDPTLASQGVYTVTLTRDPNGVYVSGDTYMLWYGNNQWFIRQTSAANVGAAAAGIGAFYVAQPNMQSTGSVAHIRLPNGEDPTTGNTVIKYSKRSSGIELYAIDGATIEGVHAMQGGSAYGAVTGGLNTTLKRVLSSFGGKHNYVVASGLMEDCIAFDSEIDRAVLADGGRIPFTWYKPAPAGLEWVMKRCMSITPAGRVVSPNLTGDAVYAHGSTGTPDWHNKGTINGFISNRGGGINGLASEVYYTDIVSLNNSSRGILLSPKATIVELKRALIKNVPVFNKVEILHPSAGATAGAAVEVCDCAVYKAAEASATGGYVFSFDVASVLNFHHNVARFDSGDGIAYLGEASAGSKFKHNIIVMNRSGANPWFQITPNVDCDYNVYINIAGSSAYWRSTTTGTAFSLSEWRTESGKDMNSVLLNAAQCEDLFLNGLAGMANGDFRLDPACTLTFVDGTPIVGNAGPREHYDWNQRAVLPGAPQRWPVPPETLADCEAYIADPTSWNFYP